MSYQNINSDNQNCYIQVEKLEDFVELRLNLLSLIKSFNLEEIVFQFTESDSCDINSLFNAIASFKLIINNDNDIFNC